MARRDRTPSFQRTFADQLLAVLNATPMAAAISGSVARWVRRRRTSCSRGVRGAHAAELDQLIGGWTATKTADDLLARLADHAVPSGRVYTAADALADPHYLARGMVHRLTSAGGVSMPVPGVVPRFSRTPGSVRTAGPGLGADTGDVLEDVAGLPAEQLGQLRSDGVIA